MDSVLQGKQEAISHIFTELTFVTGLYRQIDVSRKA